MSLHGQLAHPQRRQQPRVDYLVLPSDLRMEVKGGIFPKVEDKRSFNKEKNLGKGRALWIALDIQVSHMAEGQVQRLHLLVVHLGEGGELVGRIGQQVYVE